MILIHKCSQCLFLLFITQKTNCATANDTFISHGTVTLLLKILKLMLSIHLKRCAVILANKVQLRNFLGVGDP